MSVARDAVNPAALLPFVFPPLEPPPYGLPLPPPLDDVGLDEAEDPVVVEAVLIVPPNTEAGDPALSTFLAAFL